MNATERIYLDNAATSWPKPEAVYQAVDAYQRAAGAPAGRGAYGSAQDAAGVVASTRSACARLLGVASADRLVFATNGTDALNTAIHGIVRPGEHVVTTRAEHNSVLRPLEHLRNNSAVEVTLVDVDATGRYNAEDVSAVVRTDTRMVAITHGSNVTGAVQPLAETVAAVRRSAGAAALVLVDAAQTAGHLAIDFDGCGIDMLATGGHKGLLGPLGTGLLCLSENAAETIVPSRQGGTGTESQLLEQPRTLPAALESGNLNVPALAGLRAAVELLLNERASHAERAASHAAQLAAAVEASTGLQLVGPPAEDERLPVVSFSAEGYDPQEVAAVLEGLGGIECRAGLHCAPLLHASLGSADSGGLVRLSPGVFTTDDEVERTIAALAQLTAAAGLL